MRFCQQRTCMSIITSPMITAMSVNAPPVATPARKTALAVFVPPSHAEDACSNAEQTGEKYLGGHREQEQDRFDGRRRLEILAAPANTPARLPHLSHNV